MKKRIITFLLTMCLVPTLSFAAPQCQKLTDDQYRQAITSQPIVVSENESGVAVTITGRFHIDGTYNVHVDIESDKLGHGEIDLKGAWSITDAVLYQHHTSATHPRAPNPQMNSGLDEVVADALAYPDSAEPLDNCNPANMKASLFLRG